MYRASQMIVSTAEEELGRPYLESRVDRIDKVSLGGLPKLAAANGKSSVGSSDDRGPIILVELAAQDLDALSACDIEESPGLQLSQAAVDLNIVEPDAIGTSRVDQARTHATGPLDSAALEN